MNLFIPQCSLLGEVPAEAGHHTLLVTRRGGSQVGEIRFIYNI